MVDARSYLGAGLHQRSTGLGWRWRVGGVDSSGDDRGDRRVGDGPGVSGVDAVDELADAATVAQVDVVGLTTEVAGGDAVDDSLEDDLPLVDL